MLRMAVLGSGSSGNSTFITDGKDSLIFDLGLYHDDLKKRLFSAGIIAPSISGAFISHEHSDHIIGVRSFQKNYRSPIYLSEVSHSRAARYHGNISRAKFFKYNQEVKIGNFKITPVRNSHDSASAASFLIENKGKKIGFTADTGCITKELKKAFTDLDVLLIEFNHDVDMLIKGPYPESLKQRILGNKGHLSNIQAAQFIADNLNSKLKHLFVGHISQHNNHHSNIYRTINSILRTKKDFADTNVIMTYHEKSTSMITL